MIPFAAIAAGLGQVGQFAGGVGSVLAPFIGASSSSAAQRQANEMNVQMARDQMAFQERMDSTKYQRGVADAKAAGFNPLVAFPGSGGSPIGASAQVQSTAPNRGELFLATAKALSELRLTREMAETEDTKQELHKTEKQALAGAVADAKNREKYASSPYGKALSWAKGTLSDIGGAILGGFGLAGGTAASMARGARVVKGFKS